MPYYSEKGPGVHGKAGQNKDTAFLALSLGVVLHLPMDFKFAYNEFQNRRVLSGLAKACAMHPVWQGSCGQQIKADVQGSMQQMLVQGHKLRLRLS